MKWDIKPSIITGIIVAMVFAFVELFKNLFLGLLTSPLSISLKSLANAGINFMNILSYSLILASVIAFLPDQMMIDSESFKRDYLKKYLKKTWWVILISFILVFIVFFIKNAPMK